MASVSNRGRLAASCDHCRTRKVRCIRQEHEACQKCLQAGVQCVTTRKRLSRPYYQTTKEQFRLMASIVHHFLPDISLDKDDLRSAVLRLEHGETPALGNNEEQSHSPTERGGLSLRAQDAPATTIRPTVQEIGQSRAEDRFQDSETFGFSEPCAQLLESQENRNNETPPVNKRTPRNDRHHANGTSPAAEALQEAPLFEIRNAILSPRSTISPSLVIDGGSVILRDAARVLRYYNRSNYANFFSLVSSTIRSSVHSQLVDTQPSVEDYTLDGQPTPSVQPSNLPPPSLVHKAARKFFSEINNVVYILDYVRFQAQLQTIFADNAETTNSMLAIIYFITFFDNSDPGLFKDGVRYCNDAAIEGNLESVQAIMLMTLGYLLRNQRNVAWISLGNAIRIAQSLGLYLHESEWDEDSTVTVESKKMLWWSLFGLDAILSSILGRPQGIHQAFFHTSLPQDLELDQNPLTPPGSAKAAAELALLHSEAIQELYLRPRNRQDNNMSATEVLPRLQQWWESTPIYLKPGCPTAPSYLRSIAYLGLRYYYTLLLITQPYLLQTTIEQHVVDDNIQTIVEICENANRESISLLKQLAAQNLISKINFFDPFFILINGIIMFVRCLKDQSPQILAELDEYMLLLPLAEHLSVGQFGRESIKALAEKLRNRGQNDNTQLWSDVTGTQPSQVLWDMLEGTNFPWFDSLGMDASI